MTDSCPCEAELDRLLADQLTNGEEEAIAAHLIDCAECQERLEHLTHGKVALTALPDGIGQSRANEPTPTRVLERVARILPAQARLLAQQHRPTSEGEAAGRPAQTPHPGRLWPWPGPPEVPGRNGEQRTLDLARTPRSFFGRYEVLRPMGSGGFGIVYLGHDRDLDRQVAIKVFRGDPSAQSEPLLQEARKLAHLRHPGIVTVHDVGTHEREVYVVSDFLEGPNLAEWLSEHRPSWQEAAAIAAAVADALSHAHARLIIHRDVKPANIILTPGDTPVLIDFSLALDPTHSGGRELGVVSGSPHYMSPEQVAGVAHRIDGRTDIYSLGVVLYEMLCGRVPFRADELTELLRQVCDDEPQPLRQLVPALPPEL